MRDFRLPFDEAVFQFINSHSTQGSALFWTFFSSYRFAAFCILIAVAIIVKKSTRLALDLGYLATTMFFTDRLGSSIIKPLVDRVRPCYSLDPSTFHWWATVSNGGSMPSLHAANSFAVVVVLWIVNRRTIWLTAPIASAIAVSRVGVGVHWPSDVLCGAIFGLASATFVSRGRSLVMRRFSWYSADPRSENASF